MTWTKVTDVLPPDGEAVMVTIVCKNKEGSEVRKVLSDITFEKSEFCFPLGISVNGMFERFEGRITHWMEMPQPAED